MQCKGVNLLIIWNLFFWGVQAKENNNKNSIFVKILEFNHLRLCRFSPQLSHNLWIILIIGIFIVSRHGAYFHFTWHSRRLKLTVIESTTMLPWQWKCRKKLFDLSLLPIVSYIIGKSIFRQIVNFLRLIFRVKMIIIVKWTWPWNLPSNCT